jgi:hypothetical protein
LLRFDHEERDIDRKKKKSKKEGTKKGCNYFREERERERRRGGGKKGDIGEKEESRRGEQTVVERDIGKKRKKERAGEIEICRSPPPGFRIQIRIRIRIRMDPHCFELLDLDRHQSCGSRSGPRRN